jgi:Tfp pilus assembly protein FimT
MRKNGFTLIEVLITLIFFAGISLLGVISASFLKYRNEGRLLVDEIKTAIQYAKIQAITRGNPVYLSPLDKSLNWSKGVKLIQYNRKKNKEDLLYQWEWHHPRWSITWTGVNSLDKIMLSNSPVRAISNGKFIAFNSYTKEGLEIILNRLGRVKIKSSS